MGMMVELQSMKLPALPPQQRRMLQIAVGFVTLGMLFLLSTSLGQLEFKSGEAFGLPVVEQGPPSPYALTWNPEPFIRAFFIITSVLLAGGLVLIIASKKERKRFLRWLIMLVVYAIVLLTVLSIYKPAEQVEEARPTPGPPAEVSDANIPIFPNDSFEPLPVTPPSLPPWSTFLISLAVVAGAGVIAYAIWKWIQPPPNPLRTIVESALQDLSSGRDWEDTVIQCYQRMSTVVTQRRGIERHLNMTPREFVSRLEKSGLPAQPVENLTRLFEKARYGSHKSASREAVEAVDCLSAILQALENRS